jgi:hypothetical protein
VLDQEVIQQAHRAYVAALAAYRANLQAVQAPLQFHGTKIDFDPINPVHDYNPDQDEDGPSLFGEVYVVPYEFADDLRQENGGPGIDKDASLLFVNDETALIRLTESIPSNRWSFDNDLIHAGIPHLILDPAAGVELTVEWEVE